MDIFTLYTIYRLPVLKTSRYPFIIILRQLHIDDFLIQTIGEVLVCLHLIYKFQKELFSPIFH
jgi:hypothetical protein